MSKIIEKNQILSNAEVSLFDIGDEITYFKLHTKLNIIEDGTLEMFDAALDHVETNYAGMIIGTDANNFSVGLNLILLLERAKSKNWGAISNTLQNLQKVCTRLRLSSKPVIAATAGMALGGGCELTFGADAVQAYHDSYLGLVELRVGLIPGGGGTKEMAFRCLDGQSQNTPIEELISSVYSAFETICKAKVSQNASDAVGLGYLRKTDSISKQREYHLSDAKQLALSLSQADYQPNQTREIFVLGKVGINHIKQQLQQLEQTGDINNYEMTLAERLAYVFCGGMLSAPQFVTGQHLLDLEHEVFLSLCSEPKTHTMIEATLKKSKK